MYTQGFSAGAAVHDPSVFIDNDGTHYIFGTHMTAAKTDDLRHWEMFADGVTPDNPLFSNLLGTDDKAFEFCGRFSRRVYAVWAPDVHYNRIMNKYVMYFCTSGSYVRSSLCMAVADNAKGPYTFLCTFLHSGFDAETVTKTNVSEVLGPNDSFSRYLKKNGHYNNLSWPNCIDPNVFTDADGRTWMVYGSWSGGIFILEIDESTGMPIHPKADAHNKVDPYYGKKLIGGGHKSIEGPYIIYDKKSSYYYLFVSYGWLGRDGGYQIRLFRSKKPDGPYTDMKGRSFTRVPQHESYGLKLIGNYNFPSLPRGYKSPGHSSAFIDEDGQLFLVYHQRFDCNTDEHEPRVHQLFRTEDGWLTMAPFATDGEQLCNKDYNAVEIMGEYYLLNHESDISDKVHEPVKVVFSNDRRILCDGREAGTYMPGAAGKIKITFNGHVYCGVVIMSMDESGNPTMCITAVGDNQSIWAVKYL